MNIYKKATLRNLTNKELEELLQRTNYIDKDLLREFIDRTNDGRLCVDLVWESALSDFIFKTHE